MNNLNTVLIEGKMATEMSVATIKGTYAGELDNTAELIAHDYGIDKTRVVAEARQYFNGKVVDKAVYSWDTRRFVYAKAV